MIVPTLQSVQSVSYTHLDVYKRQLLENVMIQSIGASSGVVVAGAIFTIPAIYILKAKYPEMTVNFLQIFVSSLLGGVLGLSLIHIYVGSAPGKVDLYKAKERLKRNIPQEEAVKELIELIKAHGDWKDPE